MHFHSTMRVRKTPGDSAHGFVTGSVSGTNGRVLLADTDIRFIKKLAREFERFGYDTQDALTPEDVGKKLLSFRPVAIVMDYYFSDKRSGSDVYREVEERTTRIPDMKYVLVSSYEYVKHIARRLHLPFFQKPVSPRDIVQHTIRTITDHREGVPPASVDDGRHTSVSAYGFTVR